MRRRTLLRDALATLSLGTPRIARADLARPLKFVPIFGLSLLDPTVTAVPNTRSHAYLVFDTLYGLDKNFAVQPQMVAGHTIENDGIEWRLTLRDGLRFHDGTPVLARDAVASIRRCALRDGFCQALMAATNDLAALDDRIIRFRLKRAFPHLAEALAGLGPITPVIMPERIASAGGARPITEMIGSGPFRFIAADYVIGERAAYERFDLYQPRPEGTPSYTAGPKHAHVERVEWITIDDASTAASALLRGEVDWLHAVAADQVPMLERAKSVRAEVTEPAGSIGYVRFNHLHPPFDNPAARRALLGAIDQADAMNVVAGADRRFWRDRIGLFPFGTPLATDVGIEVMTGPRDLANVRRLLVAAGYGGERVVVLGTAGSGYIPLLSQVGVDVLRRVGLNVDLIVTDYATMARRLEKKDPPDKGGWNVTFGIATGSVNHLPATNDYIRGDGISGAPGWMTSPRFEELRQAWLDASDLSEQRRIAADMQRQLWLDVPLIPMGEWLNVTARRRELVDAPWGFAAFYGVRREA